MLDSDDAMGWLTQLAQSLRHLLAKPAFAYSVAAAAIVVASVSMTIRLQQDFPSSDPTANFDLDGYLDLAVVNLIGTEPLAILTEQVRGGSDFPTITRTPNDDVVRIVISSFWPDTARYDYSVGVASSDEKGTARLLPEIQWLLPLEDLTDFGESGMTQFLLKSHTLPDGRYGLTVTAIDKADATDTSMTVFLFEILTEE